MFKLKNLFAFAVIFTMLMSFVIPAGAFTVSNDVKGTKYEDSAQLLGSLAIMIGDDKGDFRPNDTITRAEFAKIAVCTLNLQDVAASSKGITMFKDVSVDNWANGFINVASSQKIIIGDPDGSFRPNDPISYQEAITILVRVIGQEPSATAKGGYPGGYLVIAADNQITKNAAGSGTEPASRGLVSNLTYNALTVKLMEQVGFGSDLSYQIVDKTLLQDKLNVTKGVGQISATTDTRLNSTSSLKTDEVQIGSEIFKLGESNAKDLLGYNVTFYSKKDDVTSDEVLLLTVPEKTSNKVLQVVSDNLVSLIANELKYWVDKDKDYEPAKATIDPNAAMIYNNQYVAFNANLIMTANSTVNGSVKMLDVNRDDKYDLVFVTNYENLVVEDTSSLSYRVSDKYNNNSVALDPNDVNLKFYIKDNAGKDVKFEDLKEWNVLSIAKSLDGKIINVIVNDAKAIGKVAEIQDNKYLIDGQLYEKAANYSEIIKLEDQGTFYLDAMGKIAAVDSSSILNDSYAFLMDIGTTGTIDTTVQFKLFTAKGETVVLNGAEQIKLDTTQSRKAALVMADLQTNGVVNKQLITYKTNSDNKITEIDTAKNNTALPSLTIDKTQFTENFKADGVVYNSASKKLGNINIGASTMVFDLPTTAIDETEYAIKNQSMFENEAMYNIQAFDISEDLTAKVIIVTNSIGQTSAETPIAVVSSISKTLNSLNEEVDKLTAATNGVMTSTIAKASGILVRPDLTSLKQGDIIQYKTNAKGEIEKVTLLFNIDTKTSEFKATPATDLVTLLGKVERKFANSINLTVNNGPAENYVTDGAKVYSVDTTKSNYQVSIVSAADIVRYDQSSPRLVFMRIYKDQVQDIVIIR